jgi:hypothetical protein
LAPDIVASTFEENLPLSSFEDIHEYPVATATHKAVEVYEQLIVSNNAYRYRARTKDELRERILTTHRISLSGVNFGNLMAL